MSIHELLSTFDAHYNGKSPTTFWDDFALLLKDGKLVWEKIKIPKGICQDSSTYWRGRVVQIYRGEANLKLLSFHLHELSKELQKQFEKSSYDTLWQYSTSIVLYDNLCESFYHNILNVYDRKSWKHINVVTDKNAFKRDFVVFLPIDLVKYILSFVPKKSLKDAQCVSKKWRVAVRPATWSNYFTKIRCIRAQLVTGHGLEGHFVRGSDLSTHIPGIISGSTDTRFGERSVFWNTEGERVIGAPVQYRAKYNESYVTTCFLDETTVILFRKQEKETWIELWKNYLSSQEGECTWSIPLKTLNHNISRIQLVWSLNNKTIILSCYENHFQDRTYLYRLNVENFALERINGNPILELRTLYSHLILCKDETGHLHLHNFNNDGTISESADLGRLNIDSLYDWNLQYFAFWKSPANRELILFPIQNEKVLLSKALEIAIHNPDGISPFCAGFTNQPIFIYFTQIDGTYNIVLQWLNNNGQQKIPLHKDETLIELCYLSDELLLTCSQVGEENKIQIKIWNYLDCTLEKTYKVVKDTPSNFIQVSRMKAGLMALLISQHLYFLEFNIELKRFTLTEFPASVHQINFRNGILIINPMSGHPVIASFNT